ncbi:MAG: hypothetical protein JW743_12040 [Deltaproteobacteria bacterium]|nr:hypothetical protein [Deltaproteobacteria bacterium]MBN2845158.1 hypothetical protein [Deltaproteobacteria bacterium]
MDNKEKKRHFQNALSNYSGVLSVLDAYDRDGLVHDENAPVPDNWESDPLLLLGEYLDCLDIPEGSKRVLRESTLELVERYGVESVWKDRRRYAAETEFVLNF